MGRSIIYILGILLIISHPGLSNQNGPDPKPKSPKMCHMNIALEADSPPYTIKADAQSLDAVLIRTALDQVDCSVEFTFAPRLRLDILYKNGRVDGYTSYENAPRGLMKSVPYRFWYDGIIMQDHVTFTTEKLPELRIASFPGAAQALGSELGILAPIMDQVMEVSTSEQAVQLLNADRIDVYVGDVYSFYYFLEKTSHASRRDTKVEQFFTPFPQSLIAGDKSLIQKFNEGVAIARQKGLVEEIIIKNTLQHAFAPNTSIR